MSPNSKFIAVLVMIGSFVLGANAAYGLYALSSGNVTPTPIAIAIFAIAGSFGAFIGLYAISGGFRQGGKNGHNDI